jgi:diphosphomevalonate decarboxylase
MAVLVMNFMSLEKALNPTMTEDYFYFKSFFSFARLDSGSVVV